MDLPQDVDDYIRESIDHTLRLPVSTATLELKLQCSEVAKRRLREQYALLLAKLKDRDEALERSRAEAMMNAQALRKFVEENQRLAAECAHLVSQCNKWEKECSLYDHDRDALMDFGNEADQRAKEAEFRCEELEDEIKELRDELLLYKKEHETHMVDASSEGSPIEEKLVESVIATFTKDDAGVAHTFLEANSTDESCQRLLSMWNGLRPSSQKVLSLVAELKTLQKNNETLEKDKEHLRINLLSAEEEVKLLAEENKVLNEANKRSLKQYRKERHNSGSDGKLTDKERHNSGSDGKLTDSASVKSNKRKLKMMSSSPIQGKINFDDQEPTRKPLSPLRCNSPNSRLQKKL